MRNVQNSLLFLHLLGKSKLKFGVLMSELKLRKTITLDTLAHFRHFRHLLWQQLLR
ncbi:hypothetical protein ES707_11520 [subsurface metagenome]